MVGALAKLMAALRQHPLGVMVGLLLIVLGAQALIKPGSEWIVVFVHAGGQLIHGRDIYGEGSGYLYPPFMALLAAPLSFLPELASRAIWFAASALCMIVMVRAAWEIADGPSLADIRRWERRELIAGCLGLGCGLTYVLNAFAHQQTDLFIGALMMTGALQLLRARDGKGGALIGLAAAMKATPLLWVPYLLLRRRVLAGIMVGMVAMAVNLLPDLIATPPGGGTWIERWVTRFVLPSQRLNTDLGTWGSDLIYNQSLGGTAQRLFNTTLARQDGKFAVVARPLIEVKTLKLAYFMLLALMIGISVAVAARAHAKSASQPQPTAFEFGIVVTLMLLMSPMSSMAHFGTLMLPGFCLARYAIINRNRAIGSLVATAAVLALLCNRDLVGYTAYTSFLWIGIVTITTLLLWLGCVLTLAGWGAPRAAQSAETP